MTAMDQQIKYKFTLLLLCLPFILSAQPQQLLKNFLTVDNGLSHNEVTSIVQDNDGFVWIGTRGGLNRYDGYDFKIFNQVPGDSNSLVNPSIESLFVDKKGNIWIGSKSGGVSKYSPESESFKNIIENYQHKSGILTENRILSFYEDRRGRIWMGTGDSGLIIYDENTNASDHYLGNLGVNSIVETLNGSIWVGTSRGLFQYKIEHDSLIQVEIPQNNLFCQEIKYDKKRNVLWIVGAGLVKYDLKTNENKNYEVGDAFDRPAIHQYQSVFLDNSGNIWVGTWGTGLYNFDPFNEVFQRCLIYPENKAMLNKDNDVILEIFQDKDGNFWIGTNGAGVCVLTQKLEFNTVGFHPEPNKGLINTRIMTVLDDSSRNLWLGTIGNGLIWSPDRKNFYPVEYPSNVSVSKYFVIKYLYEDNSKQVWVGTNIGLFVIQYKNGKPVLVKPGTIYPNITLPYQQVVSILDAHNILWFGSLSNGLSLLDKSNGYKEIKHFWAFNRESGNLNSSRISYLFEDSKKRVWIGTYNGLHTFNPKDTCVYPVEDLFNIKGEFTGNIITCIDEDVTGNIWVGTPNGLNKLSEDGSSEFKLDFFTEKDGLASNFVKGISHDSKGNIWLSTSNGISRFEIMEEEFSFQNYNEMDGVGGKNFTEAAVFRNREGEIFFGGTYGLTYFDPNNIEALPVAHKPIFTELNILYGKVSINQKFGSQVVLDKSIVQDDKIVIPYRYNNFELLFSALDYRAMGRNQYKYKLENYDDDWHYIGSRRSVNFNNLRPGEYRLLVMSANSHNIWNEEPTTLLIKILPPFWQTWYALLIYIVLVVGIVTIIRWNAVKQVRLAHGLEVEKLKHRQDQTINEMKLRFFTNISHELRTPLTLILAPLRELLGKKESYQLSKEAEQKVRIINDNSLRLMKLINQLLDFRKIETGNMKLNASKTNLIDFVTNVCNPFHELAEINNIDFKTSFSIHTQELWIDREKLEVIINNLLSNAFKHIEESGRIEAGLYEEEDEILLTVSDNGPGIAKTDIDFVFDRFYRGENSVMQGSSGIGLALVKQFAELHKGSVSVVSEPYQNTQFTITLPKGSAHLSADEIVETQKEDKKSNYADTFIKTIFSGTQNPSVASAERILVVEDNTELNSYLVNLLSSAYRVESARDGEEGFEKALKLIPDLIISDVMMPRIDGFEFCKKIRAEKATATIPFIFLTAKEDEQFKLLGTQLGADDYISKPFDPMLLSEKVRNILARQRKLQKQFSKSVRLEPSDIEITSSDDVFLEKAIAVIEANMQNEKFNSDILASAMNTSSSSLYRRLKSLTGYSSAEFVRSIRIKRAAQLLADKDRTVTEVAYDVGFSDVKHFRTVFQKQFNCTPSEYRQKL